MNSIRRYTVWWAYLLALTLLFIITAASAQTQPVFIIGVLDDERGPLSSGARLAVAQINDAGGVEGADGTVFRLELNIQSTPPGETLTNAITALDASRVIAVIGPETTEQVLSNLPILQSLRVPILTPAIGDTVVSSDSTGIIFRIRAAERWQGAALADYITRDLNISRLVTIQLDRASTASRVGFSVALSQIPNPPQEGTLILTDTADIAGLVQDVLNSNAQMAVTYGPPEIAREFYTQLRDAGWFGIFAYHEAENPLFRDFVPLDELRGIYSTTTWPLASMAETSNSFLNAYVRAFGRAPGPVDAAAYDAIQLIAAAIRMPNELSRNLATLMDVDGVQGALNPGSLTRGETGTNVAVVQLNSLGGPDIAARYDGLMRLTDETEVVEAGPTLTPTPEGVFITIRSAVQNVRTGPGLEYDVLGQLRQGEQARVIGGSVNFDWVVIEYRGQEGWLATYLLDVFGERGTVPVFTPPPTPTPSPATATPTPPPSADIIIVAAVPNTITLGTITNINVTVQNIGSLPAGPFAVAASFAPDEYFSAVNLTGLAAGAQQVVALPVLLNTATGNYNIVIVADLNREVNEGPQGEANNTNYIFTYKVDRAIILFNNTTLGVGGSVDLEGNLTPQPDITYTGAGLNTVGSCSATANCIGIISPSLNWDTAHYDAITNAGGVNTTFIPNAALTPGATIGILTAEGRRGVLRVDGINPGVSIILTYRVYQ